MSEGEILVETDLHPSSARWVVLQIILSGSHVLPMVIDTGAPASAISPAAAVELGGLGLLGDPSRAPFHFRLSQVATADGQALPDFDVVVLPRLGRMQTLGIVVAGLIGLNFLNEFEHVCYYIDARRLLLKRR